MKINEDIKCIKGIGEKSVTLFNRVGIHTVEDLLRYYPRTYTKYEKPVTVSDENVGKVCAFKLIVENNFVFKKLRNLNIGNGWCKSNSERVYVTFFNSSYYKKDMVQGNVFVFYGRLLKEKGIYKLEQPKFYTQADYNSLLNGLNPVYALTKGLTNKAVMKAVKNAVEDNEYPYLYEEYLPPNILDSFALISRPKAVIDMHFPKDENAYLKARERLAFDELFIFIYLLGKMTKGTKNELSEFPMIETASVNYLIERLPYRLTKAQLSCLDEIKNDLTGKYIMNRLIQGDVGSGKTIVSFLSMLLCVDNGYQAALMAPTEILARQHYEKLCELNKQYNLNIKPVLLTGSVSAKNKKEIYESIKNNEVNAVIGTHALIQDKVEFNRLALVITDEQHRFGVKQRLCLSEKGLKPHVLVMSATPIPRTLAMVLYKDMHLSIINEKTESRLAVKNCVVGPSYRTTAYKFISDQIAEGRQAYIICPMVEASEGMEDVENVLEYTEKLKQLLPENIRIECLHGKMKADIKAQIMDRFSNKDIDILVSTTVIEVGIDVPNATVMLVENAERFGLSQLHQLRGRIGRGKHQSYTIFINSSGKPSKKLEVINKSNDGFEIAQEDMRIRGCGDIFGIRQSGEMDFELADIYTDSELILKISEVLDRILFEDPDLNSEENLMMKEYLEQNEHKFIDFSSI